MLTLFTTWSQGRWHPSKGVARLDVTLFLPMVTDRNPAGGTEAWPAWDIPKLVPKLPHVQPLDPSAWVRTLLCPARLSWRVPGLHSLCAVL